MKPRLVMLAGPNGAGKSTFYDTFLASSLLPFLNADVLAAETGIDSFAAARTLDGIRAKMIADGQGFITETVFSDPMGEKLRMLESAMETGFDVALVYIGIESPELSSNRIDQRLAIGGHDVPRDKLASRYERSLANLKVAIKTVGSVDIYDNSSSSDPYRLLAMFASGKLTFRDEGQLPAWARGIIPATRKKRR